MRSNFMNARRTYLIQEEVKRVQECLARGNHEHTERVDSPVAKAFLLHGPYFYSGIRCTPQQKHLGLGVYELSVKKE